MKSTTFSGSPFFPFAAAVSFFGTLSATGTALAPENALLDGFIPWAVAASMIFYFLSVLLSGVAFLELLAAGVANAGSLTLRGRRIPDAALGLGFLLTYLMPWTIVGIGLWHFISAGI